MARTRNSLAALGVAIALAAGPALGDELGSLFFTARERVDLEKLRRGESIEGPAGVVARPDPVVTGYVKRSDGKSTVFVDRLPYPIRSERLQEKLEPRIVQKYVAPAPPPPEVPAAPDAPAAAKAGEAARSRSGDRPKT